jgi:hypothetical protein
MLVVLYPVKYSATFENNSMLDAIDSHSVEILNNIDDTCQY